MNTSCNSWSYIFLVVAFQGITLSMFFLFRNKGKQLPNKFISIILLLFSFELVTFVFYWTELNLEFPHVLGITASFHFLYGPLFFLYVITLLKPEQSLRKIHYLHFVPFILYLAYISPIYFQSAEQKATIIAEALKSNYELNSTIRIVVGIKIIHMLTYASAVFFPKKLCNYFCINFQNFPKEKLKWINIIKYCFFIYILSYLIFFLLIDLIGYSVAIDFSTSIAMSVFIYTIAYLGFLMPEVFIKAHKGSKYVNSTLDDSQANEYLERLLSYMNEEKPYLDGDIKLDDLAQKIDVPRHHLSQIINGKLGKNFFEFINYYRVEMAKKVLSDPEKKNFKILRVALESGFNNKTTFNNAFKDLVGTTPSKFREKQNCHNTYLT